MEDYDVELHLRYKKRIVACLMLMVSCWVGIWLVDWLAGILGVFANLFVLWAAFFWLKLYPKRK